VARVRIDLLDHCMQVPSGTAPQAEEVLHKDYEVQVEVLAVASYKMVLLVPAADLMMLIKD
jgi:pyruvate dehydrogenase complex dehydrogenase (E1) component